MLITTLGLWAFYLLACLSFGAMLRYFLGGRRAVEQEVVEVALPATAFLLGHGALANLWLLIALSGWFSPGVLIGVLLLVTLSGLKFALQDFVYLARSVRSALLYFKGENWLWKALGLMALLLLCVKGAEALLPPVNIDAVSFYLALPKVIAASHRLTPLPGYEVFVQVGLLGELHYAALMSLASVQAAKLFLWSNYLPMVGLLLAIGARVGLSQRARFIAVLMLVTSTAVTYISADGKVDLFSAALGLAAFYWAMEFQGEHKTLALCLTGLFTGLAVIGKVSYLPVLVPAILLLLVWEWFSSSKPKTLRVSTLVPLVTLLAGLCFWSLLPFVPHVIKNVVLFHQPLAPFVGSGAQTIRDQIWFAPATTRRIVLTYPLVLVFGQYPMQYGNLSPLVLAFAPLLLVLPRPKSFSDSQLTRITLAGILGVVLWLIVRPSVVAPRYFLSPILMLIPAAAYAADYFYRKESKPHLIKAGILLSLFFFTISSLEQVRGVPGTALRYLTGRISDCAVGQAQCTALTAVNQEARPGDRVYLGIYYRYWLRPDLLQCVSNTDEQASALQPQTPEARWSYLFERGFHYLVTDKETHEPTVEAFDPARVPDWLKVTRLWSDDRYTVYRLETTDLSRRPSLSCVQIHPPAWELNGR